MSSDLILTRASIRVGRSKNAEERRSSAAYLTHQAVADLFGERDDRGYLYRVNAEQAGDMDVLILSRTPPLPLQEVSSPDHRRPVHAESKPYAPALAAGQTLDFEIRINATRVVTGPDRKPNGKLRKRRHDVWELVWRADRLTIRTPHEVYGEWLARQLDGVAKVERARVTQRGQVRANRGGRADNARFVAANLIGTLIVLDPPRFVEAIAAGVGREKAFGCGLLCLSSPGTVLARRYPDAAEQLY